MTTAKKSKSATTKPSIVKKLNDKQKTTHGNKNQIALKADYEAKLVEYKDKEAKEDLLMRDWGNRLSQAKADMTALNKKYREYLYKFLQDAYGVYREALQHENGDMFFANLRSHMLHQGIKIQSNTTDAALVIRFVCGEDVATKTIHDYSRVLMGADYNNVPQSNFSAWLQQQTMTKVIENQRNLENKVETRAERMDRARRVVMRLIEARETKPVLSGKTTAYKAEQMLTPNGLWIGIGNATRRMDRESFYADINLAMYLPPNIDIEIYILNALARTIVDGVERYEKEILELEESVWGDALWEQLTSAGFEESDKRNEYWSNRLQSALAENEQEFAKVVAERKKARKKKS